jgi:hypothetical protein
MSNRPINSGIATGIIGRATPQEAFPFLGEGSGIEDQHGVGQFLGDVAAQFYQNGFIVPAGSADEMQRGLAMTPGEVGDGMSSAVLSLVIKTLCYNSSSLLN